MTFDNQSPQNASPKSTVDSNLVPVTVVSGFKGAGKSSLIEHLRASAKGSRCVVLEDDGEKDLVVEIEALVRAGKCDHVLIECAAGEEPFYVGEYLVYGDERSAPPESYRVDAMVTVIDASSFVRDCLENEDLADRDLAMDDDDDRVVTELLVEQVEFADVLVINKTDLVEPIELRRLEALLTRLNPRARLVFAAHGRVPVREVLDIGFFDFDATEFGAGWMAELDGEFDEVGEVHGVKSFTFDERRPFHPMRFNDFLADLEAPGLIRAKGRIWVATRHHEMGIWSLAGLASLLTYGGAWFAATPARDWPQDPAERAEIMEEWVPPFGDRRQEVAFIGVGMDEEGLREALHDCLLTDEEMKDGPGSWDSIPDPLPDWHVEGAGDPLSDEGAHWT